MRGAAASQHRHPERQRGISTAQWPEMSRFARHDDLWDTKTLCSRRTFDLAGRVRKTENADWSLPRGDRLLRYLQCPSTSHDPRWKHVSRLSSGLTQNDASVRRNVIAPKGLEKLPLLSFIQEIGAEDEIKLLVEPVGSPVKLPNPDTIGKGQCVQSREEQCRRLQIDEEHVKSQRRRDRACQPHSATEIKD